MNFGGPVWHVSAAYHGSVLLTNVVPRLFDEALAALNGVGDARLGEWRETGEVAVHVRRRLTDAERRAAGGLDVVDIRGTDEHARRVERMRSFLPESVRRRPLSEFP